MRGRTPVRVLIAEDEADLARTLRKALVEHGYAVDWAPTGAEALTKSGNVPYDAIVLDLMLPDIGGLAVLTALRARGERTPVLILTARDAVDDKVQGLNAGADDYLTKPFVLTELLARIRALIRRASPEPLTELAAGPLVLDTGARVVRRDGEPIELTAREYAILELLARRKGTVVTRSAIYDHVYDEHEDTLSNVIDVFVAALRRKIGPDVIRTRRGHGYVIDG
jgi:two-component system OmpR family response regulator